MNGKTFALLSVFAVLAIVGVAMLTADDSDAATSRTIVGHVYENGDVSVIPLENVVISIYRSGEITPLVNGTATTDSEGKFVITVSLEDSELSSLMIKCEAEGYGIFGRPACIGLEANANQQFSLDLTKCTSIVGNEYHLSEYLPYGICLANNLVPVEITVTGSENRLLIGASVTIYQDGVKMYSGETNQNGIYVVNSKMVIGTYDVELNCDGYIGNKTSVTISKTNYTPVLTMEAKEIPTYAGITTYHILMIAGVTVGIILAIVAYMLCRRNWAGVDDE